MLGDRLEQSGKERLMVNGTLDRAGEQRVAFSGVEFPDRLRLTTPFRLAISTLIYNGEAARTIKCKHCSLVMDTRDKMNRKLEMSLFTG